MKKIGYVYKYSKSENKGILVFGIWKVKDLYGTTIKNTPILFSSSDLLSEVTQDCLVYFDLNENKATNIERASLSNFNIDFINSLVRSEEYEPEYYFYRENTLIRFECLETIITEKEKKNADIDDYSFDFLTGYVYENLFDNEISLSKKDYLSLVPTQIGKNHIKDTNSSLPESIDYLYNCFGKYMHSNRHESIAIDIFDLSLWIYDGVLNDKYYGMNVEEIKYLYDIFVMEKHYDRKGDVINHKPANNVISSEWSLLLSVFSENDLKTIMLAAPRLQPALPKEFCKKNIGLLTDDYDMPDVEICKLYCIHRISNAKSVSEYIDIKDRLYAYCHCETKHLEGVGTPMCQMGKSRIYNLKKRLNRQYENVIKQNVISQLINLCEGTNVVNEIQKATPDEFNSIGLFIENYHALRKDFLGYETCKKALESYEELPQIYKNALKASFLNCVNESAISAAKSENLTPYSIWYPVEILNDWILESSKQKIKELVNERFSNLDDFEDLLDAYKYNYITGKQYLKKYKQLTRDFNTYQFVKELSDYKISDSPLTIKWYVVSNIIKQLGYDSLLYSDNLNYIRINDYVTISDIRSLLTWLYHFSHTEDIILKRAEEKICSVLSDDERWTLFEEKIVKFPGDKNIRNRLDNAYKKKCANKELFKYECIQDVMLSDVDKIKDTGVLMFIADNLDWHHEYLLEQKAIGFMKLYLWQKNPSGKIDWNLVKIYFHGLSVEAQINTLRYIFGQMASGESDLTLDVLYSEFVETSTPACSAICGVLYILKAKKDDISVSITPAMVESVIGENREQRYNFLKDCKELFYPCNGYMAVSDHHRDIEDQPFYGILKREVKNDIFYYVIIFHDTPVDIFGDSIEQLDSEVVNVAKQVLKRNCDVEIVNNKYYIPESQEFFVKQFVISYHIEDQCGLMTNDNDFEPIYINFIRKYEDSEHYVCRSGCEGCSDPNNKIPFYWCIKQICTRRAHFFLPSTKWDRFCFADFLFIVLGQSGSVRELVWRVNAEISQFICDYFQISESEERNVSSAPLKESDDKGMWDDDSSTYRDDFFDDEYDDDEYNSDCEYYSPDDDYEEPTYERYNGSYAQDVMGYSDDDIDTIFDGDPDAYWNID